jgi:hypothetical protein
MKNYVYNFDRRLIEAKETDNAQQRANCELLGKLLDQEFDRGFWRGYAVAKQENDAWALDKNKNVR